MYRWLAFILLMPSLASAQPLPPAVAHLQAELAQVGAAQQRILTELKQLDATATQGQQTLLGSSASLLQLAALPPALVGLHSLASGHTHAAGILNQVRKTSAATVQTSQAKQTELSALAHAANQQTVALHQLFSQFQTARGKLHGLEQQVLNRAAVQAGVLAATLEKALHSPAPTMRPANQTAAQLPQPAATLLPVPGRLVHGFHDPAASATHGEGWTFSAPGGSTVSSITGGTVLYSGPFRSFGGMVIISPGPGQQIIYAGLGTLQVNVGQRVAAAGVLGTLPPGGQPNLYVEYRVRGRIVSPQRLYAAK